MKNREKLEASSLERTADAAARVWSARGTSYATSEVHKGGPSLAKLLALARPHPDDRCLDLGTGAGHTAAALAEYAAHVVGLDMSSGMLRSARELYRGVANLEFVVAPAHDTGLSGFDLITARHTLHHHTDLTATLGEAARLLRPGGRMVIVDEVTPEADPDLGLDAWYDAVERARDPTHVRAYTMLEWRAFVLGVGLEWIVGDTETHYVIDVESWLGRMKPSAAATRAVYRLFEAADAHARNVFNIEYDGAQAVRFQMPMALILALKPA